MVYQRWCYRFFFKVQLLLLSNIDFSQPILSLLEPCLHEMTYKDICTLCGTDLLVYLSLLQCNDNSKIDETIQVMLHQGPTFPCHTTIPTSKLPTMSPLFQTPANVVGSRTNRATNAQAALSKSQIIPHCRPRSNYYPCNCRSNRRRMDERLLKPKLSCR